ncbi:CLUMA_CG003115, isoform A [Clunio marinus]|uniref:CLUMA_CG003115, isoform A n=1 Tax=Clunio marinus TaxID=568069 RepID=A0A1J1HMS8_9DIPT|nr:CLUMA_CG003115, isoform A [Clunio marinus]
MKNASIIEQWLRLKRKINANCAIIQDHLLTNNFSTVTSKLSKNRAKLPHWSSGQVSELNASVLLQVPGSSPGMDKKL